MSTVVEQPPRSREAIFLVNCVNVPMSNSLQPQGL